MIIYSVSDPEFSRYGQIITGYDNQAIMEALDQGSPLPESGTAYIMSEPALDRFVEEFSLNAYGGMPAQLGWCNGHNTKLNCLEYHRCSELNLGTTDFILLLASRSEMTDYQLDTAKIKAFLVPAGVMVEVYATTLHFAPCSAKPGQGFKVLIALPAGTNGPKPEIEPKNEEDRLLWACNKWLLAHAESRQASMGAVIALTGPNIDLSADLN